MTVLRARATELERGFPFGVVRQLFEPILRSVEAAEIDLLLEGSAGLAAAAVATPLGNARLPPADESGFATLHGLYWLTANLAERKPLLLAVDDLQWADGASLRFLLFLAPRLSELSVLLLCAARADESTATETVARLRSDPTARTIRPGVLSVSAVDDLVRAELGADPASSLASAFHAITGGNPFLVWALVEEVRARGADLPLPDAAEVRAMGPQAVAQTVLLRLARVSALAPPLARAVAVLGDGAEATTATRLADVDSTMDADRAIDELTRVGVLQPGHPLSFTHPIVRNAIYRDIGPRERSRLHRRAASLLGERSAAVERIAAHLLEADDAADGAVVDVLSEAAAVALERAAPEAAVTYLQRALAEPPPPEKRSEPAHHVGSGGVPDRGRGREHRPSRSGRRVRDR